MVQGAGVVTARRSSRIRKRLAQSCLTTNGSMLQLWHGLEFPWEGLEVISRPKPVAERPGTTWQISELMSKSVVILITAKTRTKGIRIDEQDASHGDSSHAPHGGAH